MNPSDVLPILFQKGINRVYHANSVTTSCSFLRHGALLSRGYVEAHGLPQTPQYTDAADRHYGIYHDVFVDSDDYHRRIRRPNHYGPVVFVLNSNILANLPQGTDVLLTRYNPSKWGEVAEQRRYFATLQDVRTELTYGTFDHMITIRTAVQYVPFGNSLLEVRLDNPQARNAGQLDMFAASLAALQQSAQQGGVVSNIVQQTCREGCQCAAIYASRPDLVRTMFI